MNKEIYWNQRWMKPLRDELPQPAGKIPSVFMASGIFPATLEVDNIFDTDADFYLLLTAHEQTREQD